MTGLTPGLTPGLTRRGFLRGGVGAAAALGLPLLFRPGLAGAARGPGGAPLLVVVFLRGGADGLALAPPLGDPSLERARRAYVPAGTVSLEAGEAGLGLHPSLAPLAPLYRDGRLALVQAVGLPDPVRSHFDAQDACERGGARPGSHTEGWLARAVLEADPPAARLPAVAIAGGRPLALDGHAEALAFERARSLRNPGRSAAARRALGELFSGAGLLERAGREALEVAAAVRAHARDPLPPGADFGRGELAGRLETLARLARADLGLSAAWVDAGGWDTHVNQGNEEGVLARHAAELAAALSGLVHALESRGDDVLVLVLTEFGRTVEPNGSGGTDHGRAGLALALGGAVAGGRALGSWPGLARDRREEGRDLRVTTDVRELLAEGARHLGARRLDRVLPGYEPGRLGLLRDPARARYAPASGSSIPFPA